jgi:hypothetical protein
MAVPVPYGKQRQGHHLEVEMAFIEVRGMTSRQLYGAGSPTSHLACQPGIRRTPTKRRFLAVVGASRACPTASVIGWRTLQRVAPRVGALESRATA